MSLLIVVIILLSGAMTAIAFQEARGLPRLDNATSVWVTYIPMTDKKRLDPFTNYTQPRQVIVSL